MDTASETKNWAAAPGNGGGGWTGIFLPRELRSFRKRCYSPSGPFLRGRPRFSRTPAGATRRTHSRTVSST